MPLPDVIGEHPQELVEAFNSVVKSYNVVIRLESLECVAEFDETGHSEPYIWPAFLVGDAANLPNFDITVPFEAEAARELLGEAGKDVRPGDIVPIPESLGRFEADVTAFYSPTADRPVPILFIGFVAQLLEKDSTKTSAIAAGHQAFGLALREELAEFISENLDRLQQEGPNAEDIEALTKAVRKRVKKALKDEVGCWDGFWSNQDDPLGSLAGLDTTLFGHDRIRTFALQGQEQVFRSPILSTRVIPAGFSQSKKIEEQYDLHWRINVQPIVDAPSLNLPSVAVVAKLVDTVTQLQQLDHAIDQLVSRLRSERGRERKPLIVNLEEYIEHARPGVVREFEVAWREFVRERNTVRGTG